MNVIVAASVHLGLAPLLGPLPGAVWSVQGQGRPEAIETMHFHHAHLNAANQVEAAACYHKASASSATIVELK